ncbi:MAG: hypothetical protein CUN56_14475 [Phototrophicales bacterium]|nr:MAG: hypothetical protein CUN56_14475 [Phototrophicales bacterium]RMG76570.1 MAG: cupin domain-containing protein [Chloroflexota bacterium]
MLDYRVISDQPDVIAPDGSEIRLLGQMEAASFVHCTLHPGQVTQAVAHKTVTELWYIISGEGELWRKFGEEERIVTLKAGVCVSIPLGAHFQFRTLGNEPLRFVIVTAPPWSGNDEAYHVPGKWQTS